MKRMLAELRIDVVVIDPFVSSHRVPENDNGGIDRVVKAWAMIADEADCAVELVHHVRKGQGGSEITVEDGRGAGALLAAARSARVLNAMTQDEADAAEVERRRSYFRVDNGKANLAPPPDGSAWFHFVGVHLGNGADGGEGDSVGVVERWSWPSPFESVTVQHLRDVQRAIAEGEWRESAQVGRWAGRAVAAVVGADADTPAGRAKVKGLLRTWLKSGALRVDRRFDQNGDARPFIVVGAWVDAAPAP